MLLEVDHLVKMYVRQGKQFRALDAVSFSLEKGSWLNIVGESGSGKSTLSRLVCGLEKPDQGKIIFEGMDVAGLSLRQWRERYRKVQMIFQNPIASFHPRYPLLKSIRLGIENYRVSLEPGQFEQLMEECHLTPALLERYPHEVSGGECQRAACLRALCLSPELLVCDEVTSALDVSLRLEIGELLRNLVRHHHIACLFVTHDLLLARKLGGNLIVLQQGSIVEKGRTEDVFQSPREPYTKKLIDSIL